MKYRRISEFASKAGTTAIALCLASTNVMAARCASPEEMTALKVAALRQQLMVAALTCHEAPYFNRFVTAYQSELQNSDHALMRFFVRHEHGRADDAYNAYKTRMANDSSMRSIKDPWFCGQAREALIAAVDRNLPLAELVADRARPIATGFETCTADNDYAPAAAPAFPSRHSDVTESATVVPNPAPAAPAALPPERQASLDQQPAAAVLPAPSATEQVAATQDTDDGDNDANGYAQANAYPIPNYAYGPYQPRWWYGAPQPMQQVQGPDGRWYLVPAGGR